ncbi:NAD kinase [Flavobacteriaceae bacterium]|jgi:NAD+ kinase|nr:NAD kinase [Bacteroidota bacterium]MDB4179608.1 NAD kinase [Flavobacteriaceae bacterium]MDC1320498.1 NAD kinase [Flavobacteriaceae bacterium]
MKVAILGKIFKSEPTEYITKIISLLEKKKVSVFLEFEYFKSLKGFISESVSSFNELDKSFDLLISIGGDGTILKAITFVKDLSIPIVGVNTGRLGFLAKIQIENIELVIEEIILKNYSISERTLIEVSTSETNQQLSKLNFALNEITLSRKNTTSMISIDTKLDNKHLNSYWADGLIISTPTGSTGYSLSCGGPIIMPEAENLIINPIAPHNLNARPLIIPDSTEIKIKVNGRENEFLISLDSRITTLSNSNEVIIKKSPFKIKMIELENESFLITLREKLMWGKDKRNLQ